MNDRVITLTVTEAQFVLVQRALRAYSPAAIALRDELQDIARLALPDVAEPRPESIRLHLAHLEQLQLAAAAYRAASDAKVAQQRLHNARGEFTDAEHLERSADDDRAKARALLADYEAAVLAGPTAH